ncbi:uncharacterized protein LOC125425304 [Sphaerodactylus townsendi]|uniref:uncharacterized protein LOC125425304 n=1 Tax=Sphaerodactylus townsendi TaxID=933632 RepID=UPI002025CE71|nr:uncharacterized protein LOC125425304 [Sphaerodactylus townsendi]
MPGIPQAPPRLGKVSGNPFPDVVKEEVGASSSVEEPQDQKPESGFPWLMVYLPVQSCHVTLKDDTGMFSPPMFSNAHANNWCNWTIWAGPDKHILIYIEGFEGKPNCDENQDKILFQGVRSSVENKVAHACRNRGTLIFATRAQAAHVVFLSKAASQNHGPKPFKGQYYIFEDYEVSPSANGDMVLEEPVLKSNSRTGFPSYIIHSRRIPDFEKVNRAPTNENHLSLSSKERWNRTNHASNLEALLRPAVSNYTPLSFSKSAKNVIDMKERQVIKPFADEYQIGTGILPGSLKKTVVLGLNGFADEEKAIIPSESQKFRMKSKLEATGVTTESVGIENNGRVPIRWRSPYVKDDGRAKFERSGFLSGVTFPQASLKVQRPPISPPRIIPEEDPYQVLQPRGSHSEISKKASNAVEFQHVEMEEGERMDGQVIRVGDGDRHVADGGRRNESHGTELLAVNRLGKSAMKTKPHLTTVAQLNMLNVFSSPDVPNSDLMGFGPTSHPEVVLPDNVFVFWSHKNESILESQHRPGDVLLEVTFGIEHQGGTPYDGRELGEDLIESVKMQVQERVKLVSNKVKELKLKEVKRKTRSERKKMNDPNLIFTFWLHLEPDEKNISRLIHSQLEGLRGTSTRSGKIQQVSVGDVNECSFGTELCGDAAICLNIYSTYFCECKEEYEDQSLTKSGTLCVRIPPSGLRFLYSYMEIFVGAMVFFIAVIVVAIVVLCTIVKKKRTKKDFSVPGVALSRTLPMSRTQPVAFDQSNINTLLSLDPARLKLRAKQPEWPLQLASTPTEVCRISIEQSECL